MRIGSYLLDLEFIKVIPVPVNRNWNSGFPPENPVRLYPNATVTHIDERKGALFIKGKTRVLVMQGKAM